MICATLSPCARGGVAELADAGNLKFFAERLAGSSPAAPTTHLGERPVGGARTGRSRGAGGASRAERSEALERERCERGSPAAPTTHLGERPVGGARTGRSRGAGGASRAERSEALERERCERGSPAAPTNHYTDGLPAGLCLPRQQLLAETRSGAVAMGNVSPGNSCPRRYESTPFEKRHLYITCSLVYYLYNLLSLKCQ